MDTNENGIVCPAVRPRGETDGCTRLKEIEKGKIMNSRIHHRLAGTILGALALLQAGLNSGQAAAVQRSFSGVSVHVAWLDQPAPTITPSGHVKIKGWKHLWYDDADGDRLDGYDTVVIQGMFDPDGNLIYARGTFTLREKLDDYTFEDFLSGNFCIQQVVQGDILFEGVFTITPQRGVQAVAMNNEGVKVFYTFPDPFAFPILPFFGRILDPHGD